jgi:excisionase family DNA binding protein
MAELIQQTLLTTCPPAMSVADIAMEMNCSLAHVLNLIHGKVPDVPTLPAVKTGRLYRVRRATFERWIEQCESEQVG